MHVRWRRLSGMAATLALTVFAVIPGWAGAASATTAAALVVNAVALPSATGAVPYSQQLPASGGAGAPYTFAKAATSKRLPPGLTLDSTGEVSGTPTQVGTFPFTVRVTDQAGGVQSEEFSISVVPGISLHISGYVGSQCSVQGPFQSGSMTVKPFALGPIKSVKGTVQVPDTNGPSLVSLSLGSSGSLGLGWLTLINTSNAQCSAINPIFSLGRPTRIGLAAVSGSGWFIATINGVNYTLSVQFAVVTRY